MGEIDATVKLMAQHKGALARQQRAGCCTCFFSVTYSRAGTGVGLHM